MNLFRTLSTSMDMYANAYVSDQELNSEKNVKRNVLFS